MEWFIGTLCTLVVILPITIVCVSSYNQKKEERKRLIKISDLEDVYNSIQHKSCVWVEDFKIKNTAYKIVGIPRYLQILSDSAELVNKTTNPNIFFERYEMALIILLFLAVNEISDYEELFIDLINSRKQLLENFVKKSFEQTILKAKILKTQKAKINRIKKIHEKIIEHTDVLEIDDINYIGHIYADSLKEIELNY